MLFVKSKQKIENISDENIKNFSQKFNIHPIVMKQIIARGFNTFDTIQEFLYPSKKSFNNPFDLNGMQEFVNRLNFALKNKEKILIFGDYDVDGISATAIMIKTINMMGGHADFYLPNRYIDGYGLTKNVILKIKNDYNPSLIITVDCGISCFEEVEYAKTLGIEIMVTDHHEIPEKIPSGIVINAKIKNQKYPYRELCGTGLAFKISQALIGEKAFSLLPIASIATIADIVPLTYENRAIVANGLKHLNDLPLGIRELIKSLKIDIKKITVSDISFKIAPRLNASGRMGDAKDSLMLYLVNDNKLIKKYIYKINNHNINRQNLCTLAGDDCDAIISKMNMSKTPVIILSSKDWDHGILGIVSAKLSARYNRPVFLFTEEENGEMRGSGRSVLGVNIHELLSSMQDILVTYGGHPIAAGVTLRSENFNEFVRRVNEYLLNSYGSDVFFPNEEYDDEIKLSDINDKFANDLLFLEPCGCDNPQPKFLITTKNFTVVPMKNHLEHCNIKLGKTMMLVYFNYLQKYGLLKKADSISVIFEIQADRYSSLIKGVVKAIDCGVEHLKVFNQNFVIPYLEQLKFITYNNQKYDAQFRYFTNFESVFELKDFFGTAFVINSEKSFNILRNKIDWSKIGLVDVYNGGLTSGINAVFICPQNIDFASSYKKIVFLDNVLHDSYINKLNEISEAEIYIFNGSNNQNFFNVINISRENFVKIFKDIKKCEGNFVLVRDIYEKIVKTHKVSYSYRDFYSALCVFEELGIIEIEKHSSFNYLKFNNDVKTELANSKIYQLLEETFNKKSNKN